MTTPRAKTARRCDPKDPKSKIRFASRRAAHQALNLIWRQAIAGNQRSAKMPCRWYGPCTRCRGFHLTSMPERRN